MAWILEAALFVSTLAFAAVCALVIATPFETRQAVFALPLQQVTVTELVWLVAAATFVAAQVALRQAPVWRTPVTTPWLVWMGFMVTAAAAALTANRRRTQRDRSPDPRGALGRAAALDR